MAKFNPGDLLSINSDAVAESGYWWEGSGLLLSTDNGKYLLEMIFYNRINRRNLSVTERINHRLEIPIETADKLDLFYLDED
jgi:hypothetical protein